MDFPKPLPILSYGKVSLDKALSMRDALAQLHPGDGIVSDVPQRMENYNQA